MAHWRQAGYLTSDLPRVPKYKYTNTVIHKQRMMADETDKHRFGMTIRRDLLDVKATNRVFRARCYCKWIAPDWHATRRFAKRDWEIHMLEAEKQGRLLE